MIWESLNKLNNKGKRIALKAIRDRYVKKIAKSNGIKTKYRVMAKSMFSEGNSYMAEIIFSNTKKDSDGYTVPYTTLLTKLNGMKADLEHCNLRGIDELDHQYLFEVKDSFFDGTNHIGLVEFNPKHQQFGAIWEQIGDFGASFEYELDEKDNPTIIGLSGTFNPVVEDARVINFYVENRGE